MFIYLSRTTGKSRVTTETRRVALKIPKPTPLIREEDKFSSQTASPVPEKKTAVQPTLPQEKTDDARLTEPVAIVKETEPDTEMEGFEKYIMENQRKPAGLRKGNVYNVELSLIIRTGSTHNKIKIVSTPGKAFSDEAIRLLKEGPKWKPATMNGEPSVEPLKITKSFR